MANHVRQGSWLALSAIVAAVSSAHVPARRVTEIMPAADRAALPSAGAASHMSAARTGQQGAPDAAAGLDSEILHHWWP